MTPIGGARHVHTILSHESPSLYPPVPQLGHKKAECTAGAHTIIFADVGATRHFRVWRGVVERQDTPPSAGHKTMPGMEGVGAFLADDDLGPWCRLDKPLLLLDRKDLSGAAEGWHATGQTQHHSHIGSSWLCHRALKQ
jgi:hypothetical protein